MNASYYTLVKQHLPSAAIVYDRYHVQAQFGRDVLGQVRLSEAREHQKKAKALTRQISLKDKDDTLDLKQEIRNEKRQYNLVKKARWIILMNKNFLSASKQASLNEILESHSDLAICYAMKEELLRLFELKDHTEAEQGWKKWFDAAINSLVPALVKFGRQKLKRLDGLVAHASFPINTGKLEGFNNKIKVAKRNAYGFRNLSYFFSYIKYLPIHKIFS
jgi:transposase